MCSLRMTSPFRIVIIATRHISRALSSMRNAFPLPTNTLLYFPLADQRPDYLWPVQAQHRYGVARLLFANHRLDFSSLCLAIARYCCTMHCLCVSSPRHLFSSLCRRPAALCLAITHLCYLGSCESTQCIACAFLRLSSLYQLRSLSALCYRFADRCAALLLLLSASPCASVTLRVDAC